MPRDDFYRNTMGLDPKSYDRVIDHICKYNPYCRNEEWAIDAVHWSINAILYSDKHPAHAGTGMCLAVRFSPHPDNPNYHKVILAFTP